MIFILFFAYFFVTSSIVALEDGFDETIREKGYPEDFRGASGWSNKEYAIWAFSWLSESQMVRFKEIIRYN
jgi:hypothetical protein